MKYFTTTSKVSRRAVDCVIVGVYDGGKLGIGAMDIDAASKGVIRNLIKSGDISGKPGKCTMLRAVPGVRAARVAVAGLGKTGKFDAAQFRKAISAAASALADTKAKQVLNCLTLEPVADCDPFGC